MNMYFIAILLPPEVNEKVLALKKWMLEKYDCKVGLKSPAHITLVPPFWMEEEKEEQLIIDVEHISREMQPFDAATHDFSCFPPKTIFIALAPNASLEQVKKTSDQFFSNHPDYKIRIDSRPFHPHITIATRDFYKRSFQEAWAFFAQKEFREEWRATGISILRHNKKNWDV
ncbi:MAG TPA: 2'-5' RNA ligase family protein, partial [Flavisolibacter sp.]